MNVNVETETQIKHTTELYARACAHTMVRRHIQDTGERGLSLRNIFI